MSDVTKSSAGAVDGHVAHPGRTKKVLVVAIGMLLVGSAVGLLAASHHPTVEPYVITDTPRVTATTLPHTSALDSEVNVFLDSVGSDRVSIDRTIRGYYTWPGLWSDKEKFDHPIILFRNEADNRGTTTVPHGKRIEWWVFNDRGNTTVACRIRDEEARVLATNQAFGPGKAAICTALIP